MRDAFGGVFMIRIFLIFIIIYVGFTAIALNYAKAFKAKDLVIKYIEDNEIDNVTKMSSKEYSEFIAYIEKNIVNNLHYSKEIDCTKKDKLSDELCLKNYGIRITKVTPSKNESNKIGVYYRVNTYFGYDIGFFTLIRAANNNSAIERSPGVWTITGETRTIVKE